ncbi:MAG: EscU/YscU/HrcU family type III secretion system export apparatus switch protein [Steroidobacteraceae bacterium]
MSRELPRSPVAVALHYHPERERAPRVVAKGGGETAARILAIAKEHGVPLQQDPALAAALSRLDLNREIPRELYVAVAEVLRYVWSLEREVEPARTRNPSPTAR